MNTVSLSFAASTFEQFQEAFLWLKEQGTTPVVTLPRPTPPPSSAYASSATKSADYGPNAKEYFEATGESRIRPSKVEIEMFPGVEGKERAEKIAQYRLARRALGFDEGPNGEPETTTVPDDGEEL